MTTKLKGWVDIGLERKEAEELRALLLHNPDYKEIVKQLDEQLAPIYEYEVKCTDCPRTFAIESKKPLTKKRIAEGGICVNCSDDYK